MTILSDSPADIASLADSVAAINATTPDIVQHLNAEHGYTIPPPPFQPSVGALRRLKVEHAAIHTEHIAQEHTR